MTGLQYIVAQIHTKDQSVLNLALLWENTGYIEPGLLSSQYFHARIEKRLNTKRNYCAKLQVKHSVCVNEFLMEKMKCSFPWIKSYKGKLSKCWADRKVFELVNLISNITNFTSAELYYEMVDYGCLQNCESTSWIETKSISSNNRENANFSKFLAFFPATVKVSNLLPLKLIAYVFKNIYFKVKTMEETFIYGYGDLVADFGGYLGLLLGASLITLYDSIVNTFTRIRLSLK